MRGKKMREDKHTKRGEQEDGESEEERWEEENRAEKTNTY